MASKEKNKSALKVELVKKNYHDFIGNKKVPTFSTNIYSITFDKNILQIDNADKYDHGRFSSFWYNIQGAYKNFFWIESNTLYFENISDRYTLNTSSWSQLIAITFVDGSHQEFYTYGTTIYYPWER